MEKKLLKTAYFYERDGQKYFQEIKLLLDWA
jgi:hypothetical protein